MNGCNVNSLSNSTTLISGYRRSVNAISISRWHLNERPTGVGNNRSPSVVFASTNVSGIRWSEKCRYLNSTVSVKKGKMGSEKKSLTWMIRMLHWSILRVEAQRDAVHVPSFTSRCLRIRMKKCKIIYQSKAILDEKSEIIIKVCTLTSYSPGGEDIKNIGPCILIGTWVRKFCLGVRNNVCTKNPAPNPVLSVLCPLKAPKISFCEYLVIYEA